MTTGCWGYSPLWTLATRAAETFILKNVGNVPLIVIPLIMSASSVGMSSLQRSLLFRMNAAIASTISWAKGCRVDLRDLFSTTRSTKPCESTRHRSGSAEHFLPQPHHDGEGDSSSEEQHPVWCALVSKF